MGCYISSNDNRFYAAIEEDFGVAASVTEVNRVPAVSLKLRQEAVTPRRLDKTGGRTFVGLPSGFRKHTTFELTTLMVGWADQTVEPPHGALFQAALGGAPVTWAGAAVASMTGSQITFAGPHGLTADQAVSHAGEIRFVLTVVDPHTVVINAPFAEEPAGGALLGPTVTYLPADKMPSLTVFDFWDPSDSIHRILTGAGVDQMELSVNGDYHQFLFTGAGREIVDNASFEQGQAGLLSFPAEPPVAGWSYSVVPGNLGQIWFGAEAKQFLSVLEARIKVDNNLEMRDREFGAETPRCLVPGMRSVTADFRLYANTRAETVALYQASRQRSPITMMLQLGQSAGHLCGVLLKAIVPELPEFDDGETRLQWRFRNCKAQGTANDECVIAFG
jgi:hypothetical protein